MADVTKRLLVTFEGKDVEFLREIMASWYGRKKQTINLGMRQRISALILLAISIIIPILTTDLTASLFLLPLSISLLFSKKIYIN